MGASRIALLGGYAGLLAVAGLVLLFAPEAVGSEPPVVAQLVGAAFLGFASLTWTARGLVIGGIYGRAVVAGNQTFSVVGALVLGRHLLDGPSVAAGIGFGILLLGAVLFGVVLRRSPVEAPGA
ncbi:MAG TPA: hypothetical protein VGB53_16310 [Rubricoccaceae bacterium]